MVAKSLLMPQLLWSAPFLSGNSLFSWVYKGVNSHTCADGSFAIVHVVCAECHMRAHDPGKQLFLPLHAVRTSCWLRKRAVGLVLTDAFWTPMLIHSSALNSALPTKA